MSTDHLVAHALMRSRPLRLVAVLLAVFAMPAVVVSADEASLISAERISSIQTQLDEASKAKS